MKFLKSLKFKLALWYSMMLLVFALIFVFAFNLIAARYIAMQPGFPRGGMFRANPIVREITENERELLRQARLNDLENIRQASIVSIVPLILLSFLGGYLIAQKNLKPLENLSEEMEKRDSSDLQTEIYVENSDDEISSLIQSFNRMNRRLHNSFEVQKEFVENVSHEIKTPLAILSANIDSALEQGTSKKDVEEVLKNSKESVIFMNKLTEDLLLLSFIDHGLKKEKVNIKNILEQSISQSRKLNGIIEVKELELFDCQIKGNDVLLQRAFSNIIENSIKYSKGSIIEVGMESSDGKVLISLKDNGVGIPKEMKEKIFSRFFRIDKSRSRETGGAGLGLSITSEIIQKHNGTIYVKDSKKGAHFVVEFDI
jgi:signal transduction histidine kinase